MTIDRPEPYRELDWDPKRARSFGERAVDLWTEFLDELPDLPVAHARGPDEVHAAVGLEIPAEPLDEDELVEHMRKVMLENSMYPGHPAFMAYITGAGTVPGAVADLIAAGLNPNLGGWLLSPAASEIEVHLVRWFCERFGLPPESGGLMVSGGAMANFVALKAARDAQADWDVRARGVAAGRPLAIYSSEEVHVTTSRAADMLGLGSEAVRLVPVDESFRMRTDYLEAMIAEDVAADVLPVAVIGTAGTTGTGSIDPLPDVAAICRERGLWFHVDAAYGGGAAFAEDLRPLIAGIENADSIAFDPHKWLYTPHSGGCVLVRDIERLAASFDASASYVYQDRVRTDRGRDLRTLGPQFSRGFQAFKVWVSLLAHGHSAYGRRISHDAALARYLADVVRAAPDFELMAPVPLSICCFRYVPPDLAGRNDEAEYLDRLNQAVMTEVQLDGRAFYSNAVVRGTFCLRICIVNFRTEAEHIDRVVEVTREIGERLDAGMRD